MCSKGPAGEEAFDCANSVWSYQLSIEDHLTYLGHDVGTQACAEVLERPAREEDAEGLPSTMPPGIARGSPNYLGVFDY